MIKTARVLKEYEEPFIDVVRGFAVMGYSRKATAQTMDINPSWFNKLCERYDLKKHFHRTDYLKVCKPTGHAKGKKINQPQRYSGWYLLSVLRGYSPRISPERFNELQRKPCADTYIRRFGSWRKARYLAHRKENKN